MDFVHPDSQTIWATCDQGLKKIEEIEPGDRVLTRSEYESDGPLE